MFQFDRCVCINLNNRPDRWRRFCEGLPPDWPFPKPERWPAVAGRACKPPPWWHQGGGAWGCYRSHVSIIERALSDGVPSVLILEDDALFPDDFGPRVRAFMAALPEDWGWVYLGGQHLFGNRHPPLHVNDLVVRPYNINRTHAYGLRGGMLRTVYAWLIDQRDWRNGHHIDHHFGRLHQQRRHPIYAPAQWLVGQAAGKSNVSGRDVVDRFWIAGNASARRFVAVVGLHSSGSSCVAGVLHRLGVHMGNKLGGYWGTDPDKQCGFEAVGLAQICETIFRFPSCTPCTERARKRALARLKNWIGGRCREADRKQTLAGGKYPHLCRLGPELLEICGSQLLVVDCERPLEESIASMVRRTAGHTDPAEIDRLQRWLAEGKRELIAQAPSHLTVSYHALLADPVPIVRQLADYCGLTPTAEQITKTVEYVRPEMWHVK